VNYTFTTKASDTGKRLDVFLASETGLSRSQIKKILENDEVRTSDGQILKASLLLSPGLIFTLDVPESQQVSQLIPENIPLDFVYRDDNIAVINKPPGLVVHPGRGNLTGTLAAGLLYRFSNSMPEDLKMRPGIVHRLDKNTSGLLIVALNEKAHLILSEKIKEREIRRYYTAFVWGHPSLSSGIIDKPIGRDVKRPTLKTVVESGRESVTLYETVHNYSFISKLSLKLQTGRTHQIRVHLASIGHHVFGDPDYGGREERLKGFNPEIRVAAKQLLGMLGRQALHASELRFIHPFTGEKMIFTAELPEDLALFENRLKEFEKDGIF